MSSRIPFWSSVRDLFGGSSSRRRRSRGKRPAQSFLAQFDGRDGVVGRQAPAPFGGFDALEVRVMLAATPTAESDFGFDTATGTITSYSGAGGDIVIPATIGGVTVTGIGNDAFKNNATLTSLSLPTGVTTIGSSAFERCTGLTSLSLPTNLTTIGERAFYGCGGLTSLTIPEGVTSISNNVFAQCTGLTSLTIPDGVTSIGFNAFGGCNGLTSLTIPNSVTIIYNRVFENCTGLTSLYFLGNAPTLAGIYTFDRVSATIYYLTGTTGWTNPFKGLTAVGVAAVDYRSGDFAYSISKDSATITEYTGSGGAVTIPDTIFGLPVTGIGDSAFAGNTGLTSIVIHAGITSIGANAFKGCTGLTSLSFLGNAPATVGGDAFSGVTGTIYYLTGTTGWSSLFNGLTAIAINAAPTAVSLSPASASIAENTSTATRLKVADVVVTDDGAGTNATTLSGVDAARFEVDAGVLYLKAGTLLDFETKTSYSVTVSVADSSIAGSTPVTATFTLTVTDVVEDFTKPVLVGVAAPAARTYPSSAKLLFTATFSEPVNVAGPARISFTGISGGAAGTAARLATYESGSGTSQIVFSYLITAGEAATKGLVVAGVIQLPTGASVADLAGNTPAALTFTPPAAGSVKVDGSVPVLTKTTGPAAKTFKAGEVLSFSVTWNENVFVVGAPRLLIAVGGSPREAVYASGSGSKTVKFNYVAAAGDNGVVSLGSGAIALSGGTIRDLIGNPAGLVLKAVNLSKVAIDTTRPAVVSVALPSAGSYAKGKTATIGVTFGETLKVTSKPTLAVTVAPGVTRTFVFSKATGGTAFFTYKFTAAETVAGFTLPGAISLAGTAAIRDAVGNAAILSVPAPV